MADPPKPTDPPDADGSPQQKDSNSTARQTLRPGEYPKGNVAHTRGWEPGDPTDTSNTKILLNGMEIDAKDLPEEDRRFLESDLAKEVARSAEFKKMLDDQRRVREFWRETQTKAKPPKPEKPITPEPGSILDGFLRFSNFLVNAVTKAPAGLAPVQEVVTPQAAVETGSVNKQEQSPPMVSFLCFLHKVRWQISEHPRRSLVLAIPAAAWAAFFTMAGFIQNASGKPLFQWLQDNGLPSLMTLILISCVIVLLLTAIVAARIVLPANSELEAIKPLFEKLTPEQKTVLRWVLPLGRSPISIPQSDKNQLERIYQETAFVTRHPTGHYEVNKDTASRLALLLKFDEVKERRRRKIAQNLVIETKDVRPKRQLAIQPSAVALPEVGSSIQASRRQRVNDWRKMITEAQGKFKQSGLSLLTILEQDSRFESFQRHLSTRAFQALKSGIGIRSMDDLEKMLEDEIVRVEENWGLR